MFWNLPCKCSPLPQPRLSPFPHPETELSCIVVIFKTFQTFYIGICQSKARVCNYVFLKVTLKPWQNTKKDRRIWKLSFYRKEDCAAFLALFVKVEFISENKVTQRFLSYLQAASTSKLELCWIASHCTADFGTPPVHKQMKL